MQRFANRRNAFGSTCLLLLLGLLSANGIARAQIAIGMDMPVDEREAFSGFFPGDAGYWIGGSDGYIYDCWSEDNRAAEWGLFCRTYQSGKPLADPVQIVQSFGADVFFPAGCSSTDGSLYLVWASSSRLFFSRSEDRGLSWIDPQRVDRGQASVVHSAEPRVACNGSNVFVAWEDSREGENHVYFNSSPDAGESWQEADVRIDQLAGEVEGYRYGPVAAADVNGNVFISWVKNGHIYVGLSGNSGLSWGEEVQLDQLGVPDPASSRPSISVTDNGNVYVAWTSGFGAMVLNRSDDFGASWLAAEQQISDPSAVLATWGTLTADQSGNVYGVWYYQPPDQPVLTVRFNHSADGGVSWKAADVLLGTTGVGFHPFTPHLSSDESGRLYVIWLRYITGGLRHIYGNASFDYGETWVGKDAGFQMDSAPEETDINAHEPFVACDQNGTGAATWIDRRDLQQTHLFINSFGAPLE